MFSVNKELCIGCGKCINDCTVGIIKLKDNKADIAPIKCLECGHCIAVCPVNAVSNSEYDINEIIPYSSNKFDIQPETLLNFIKFRRSTRSFKNIPVEDEKIKNIIEAGRYSPSAGNQQPLKFIVLNKTLKEFTKMAIDTYQEFLNNDKDIVLKALGNNKNYLATLKNMCREYKNGTKDRLFFNAPAVIVIAGKQNADLDAGIASSNMELMANAQGLGACYIGFFKRACTLNSDINQRLGLLEDETVYTALALGYKNVEYKRTTIKKKVNINLI